jgi:tRNA threonylcarbamoyladenosine biosynthesis protein TsaB
MRSLRQIVEAHAPVLVLDAASTRIHAGWLTRAGMPRWQASTAEAGIGVFTAVQALEIDVNEAGAFVFCEGPGSILGIRTVAMAIRAWCVLKARPVFTYTSIALLAEGIGDPSLGVIVDARRDTWHHFQLGHGLRRLPVAELPMTPLVMPEQFRHWAPLPTQAKMVQYDLPDLLQRTHDALLFKPTDAPDAFLVEAPEYVTWTPQIHRAPAPR